MTIYKKKYDILYCIERIQGFLSLEEERKIIDTGRRNIIIFAWYGYFMHKKVGLEVTTQLTDINYFNFIVKSFIPTSKSHIKREQFYFSVFYFHQSENTALSLLGYIIKRMYSICYLVGYCQPIIFF